MSRSLAAASSCLVVLGLLMGAVKVQPAEVMEIRVATLDAAPDPSRSFLPHLSVTLNVEGPGIAGATKWGKIKVTEAVDDVGTDLRRKPSLVSFGKRDQDFREIDRGRRDEAKQDRFEAELTLDLPARKAMVIKSLRGEFELLVGGEEKIVTITKLKSLQGKPLTDPTLQAAGINGKVTKAEGDDPSLAIEYKGSIDAIKQVEIVDASGASVSNGLFSRGFGDTQNVDYALHKPLDDEMTMKIHLVVGQKLVKVPFELKDVKLP